VKSDIKTIETQSAPLPIGCYSQAVKAGPFVFISGQIGLVPSAHQIPTALSDQISQVFANLAAVAKEAGGGLEHVVKYTIYLTDLSSFPEINAYMEDNLPRPFPARATVEVSALPKEAKIEIDAVLYI
jgi:2-iminobutanoate/2-iminopropanoate deaminase